MNDPKFGISKHSKTLQKYTPLPGIEPGSLAGQAIMIPLHYNGFPGKNLLHTLTIQNWGFQLIFPKRIHPIRIYDQNFVRNRIVSPLRKYDGYI